MRSVLFVDDESEILDGLQVAMRRYRKQWKSYFAVGGAEALERLEKKPVDIVVSDMRMPEMDGSQLLTEVREKFPDSVRIVLSGHSEHAASLRAARVAHQFISKPCSAPELESALRRAFRVRELMVNEPLRALVGKISNLPAVPELYTKLAAMVDDPDADAERVAGLIEQDASLTGKLLQLVNSAFFAPAVEVTEVKTAVVRLGFSLVKDLVLAAKIFEFGERVKDSGSFSTAALQSHSVRAAQISRGLVETSAQGGLAMTAAILHDIGKLILAVHLGSEYGAMVDESRSRGVPLFQVEMEHLGVSHAEVGGYLLGIWGLPFDLVEAVAFHHRPKEVAQAQFGALAATHLSSALAHEACAAEGSHPEPTCIETDYLESIRVAHRLEEWRGLFVPQPRKG